MLITQDNASLSSPYKLTACWWMLVEAGSTLEAAPRLDGQRPQEYCEASLKQLLLPTYI